MTMLSRAARSLPGRKQRGTIALPRGEGRGLAPQLPGAPVRGARRYVAGGGGNIAPRIGGGGRGGAASRWASFRPLEDARPTR